ncbi:Armadillo repeat-containing protein 8 [Gracilariopsis chorda]|uniref:Armadillo repeat-containing protein 8 n=1 Tax=Gracilariopsis chorda TaxID=448386 RepID=A0A2V3J6B0_9FLOR|nr:Armadillo repeat-containing protein 8 [Gracilariopsis chorda]|eukprot:PXF49945.1 Armadillo repeat-containing protein 8 [Gracilariopsis chorda]
MITHLRQHITALEAPQLSSRIAAARSIKNAVVGNPTNKRLFISNGVIQPLITAASHDSPELAEQAISAIGSLASFLPPLPVEQLAPPILRCLFSEDIRPVNAAARALKLIVCSDAIDINEFVPAFTTPDVARRLVELISYNDDGIPEVCAVVLSRICVSVEEATVFEQVNAITALVQILCRTNHERCIEACLSALSALSRNNSAISRQLTCTHGLVNVVMPLTHSTTPSLRLTACQILTIFHSDGFLPSGLDSAVVTALVNLLDETLPQMQITAAFTLSDLVGHSPELQSVATKNKAVSKLITIFYDNMPQDDEQSDEVDMVDVSFPSQAKHEYRVDACASALTALAALTRNIDASRVALVEEDALPRIIVALQEDNDDIVLAAVQCVRSLSRSVKIVRRDIADDQIGVTLLHLLSSSNVAIRRSASAALCNLVLEFSPIRTSILENGGICILTGLLSSVDDELRENALWALKNILFKADSETKTAVMNQLGYTNLQALCTDTHLRIRELAMMIVRNLACSGSTESQREELDALFAATGNKLISILSEALRVDTESSKLAVQALYVVCNIASGTEEHKASLIDSDIPGLILKWTSHKDEGARIAAVWCAINLSWKDRRTPSQPSLHRQRLPRCVLRPQHLPAPSSPFSRRVLERSDRSYGGVNAIMTEQRDSSPETEMDVEHENVLMISAAPEPHHLRTHTRGASSARRRGPAPKSSGYQWRIERLRELGFEVRLRSLTNDPHIEVQGRARAALEFFDCGDVNPLDYSPSALLEYDSPSVLPPQSSRALSHSIVHRVLASDSSSGGST